MTHRSISTMNRQITVKPEDGFDHWHAVMSRDCSLAECRPIPDTAFRASATIEKLGPLNLSEVWSSVDSGEQLRVDRREQDIRRDGRDEFMLWLTIDGSPRFEQNGRAVSLEPGDMMLYDHSRPFALDYGARSHYVIATIPRALLVSRLAHAASLVARVFPTGSPLVAVAWQMAREFVKACDALPPAAALRLSSAAIDLWAATLESCFEPGVMLRDARMQRRLRAAQHYMLDKLADPELTVERIAASQHMSSRTLVRLFASEGDTPMRWLWRRRLDSAYRLLAERRVARVQDAAFASGFLDMSHFSRAFRAAFGRTPLEVLKN